MRIQTRVNLNQKVFCIFVAERTVKRKCGFCNGGGSVEVVIERRMNPTNVKCPKCNGQKRVNAEIKRYFVDRAIIFRISVHMTQHKNSKKIEQYEEYALFDKWGDHRIIGEYGQEKVYITKSAVTRAMKNAQIKKDNAIEAYL